MATFIGDASKDELSKLSPAVIAVHVGLNVFLAIIAILGNSLILVALKKVSSLHPPTKLLFRCLAVCDLLVGLILHPLHVIGFILDYQLRIIGHHLDHATYIFSFVLCGLSIFVSTAISLDRLLALKLRLRYKKVVTLSRIRAAILGFLLLAVSIGLVYVFVDKIYALIITLICVAFSIIISTFSYVTIFRTLRKHQSIMQSRIYQVQPNGGGNPLNIAKYKKTVSSIAWVQLALIACYTPFIVGIVVIKVNNLTGFYSEMFWTFSGTFVYFNSSLNPFLYCWKLREVRQAASAAIRRYICCKSS